MLLFNFRRVFSNNSSCIKESKYFLHVHNIRCYLATSGQDLTPGMSHLAILTAGCCRGPCSPGRRCSCRRPRAWCWRWWAWPRWCWRGPPTARPCPAPSLWWWPSPRPCNQVTWTDAQMSSDIRQVYRDAKFVSLFLRFGILLFTFYTVLKKWNGKIEGFTDLTSLLHL